jgi:hypothetical protein
MQGALRESAKYMTKARTPDKDARCAALGNRIELCERFVQVWARALVFGSAG